MFCFFYFCFIILLEAFFTGMKVYLYDEGSGNYINNNENMLENSNENNIENNNENNNEMDKKEAIKEKYNYLYNFSPDRIKFLSYKEDDLNNKKQKKKEEPKINIMKLIL